MYKNATYYQKQQIEHLHISEVFVRVIDKIADKIEEASQALDAKDYGRVRTTMEIAHDLLEGLQNSIDEPAEAGNTLFVALRTYFQKIKAQMDYFELHDRIDIANRVTASLRHMAENFRTALKAEKERQTEGSTIPEKQHEPLYETEHLLEDIKHASLSISA